MTDKFAYFYQPLKEFDLRQLLAEWSAVGIMPFNPSNHLLTSLLEDGSQVPTTVNGLEKLLSSPRSLRFQLWLSDDTDLSCHIRKIDAANLVEQYGLDGLYPLELKRVVDSLVSRFEKRAALQLPELFLIVDCRGYTIDVNWESLAKGGKYECHFCPDVLGVARSRRRDFGECLERKVVSTAGEYLIATEGSSENYDLLN
jgi:hypothetical protein